jgi:hypothetical protein
VALVTKSEVEHLEDGFRWRKYGQKAVKNSPYPRLINLALTLIDSRNISPRSVSEVNKS